MTVSGYMEHYIYYFGSKSKLWLYIYFFSLFVVQSMLCECSLSLLWLLYCLADILYAKSISSLQAMLFIYLTVPQPRTLIILVYLPQSIIQI
jgi:hypothetical protein